MQSALKLKKSKLQNIFKALSLAIFVFLMGVGASTTVAAQYEPVSTFISEVKNPPIPFSSIAVAWDEEEPLGTEAEIFIRFQNNEGWTEWQDLHPSIDKKYENENVKPTAFITTDLSGAYQYKVELSTENKTITPKISNIEITFVHAHDAKETEQLDNTVTLADNENLSSRIDYGLDIITRNEWGANETLRVWSEDRPPEQLASLPDDFYDKYADEMKIIREVAYNASGEKLTWPLEYPEEVSKIIVHHTATTKNLDNPEQAIRDIYYYHTMTRGWGDIGYNYIIDPLGRIYEGRYGGDGVVAAHAGGRNVGSIGIAILGDYHNGEPTTASINSLTALIKAKSGQFNINTTGSGSFRGDYLPNIIGHRDVGSTTCPGDQLYDMLPRIRASAKDGLSTTFIDRRRVSRTTERPYDYDLEGTLKIPTYEVALKQS
ncbi:hypothetical protein GF340_02990, partial [Candidatus Peregrinibacteria bacterium]|nr:hypothetical protein [Candidatus Peregrinibacteria bacterium]